MQKLIQLPTEFISLSVNLWFVDYSVPTNSDIETWNLVLTCLKLNKVIFGPYQPRNGTV